MSKNEKYEQTMRDLADHIRSIDAANDALRIQLQNCRNELCSLCGEYRTAHIPYSKCNTCKWANLELHESEA